MLPINNMFNCQNGFTARSLLVGLFVGAILCCSNMYFGLQSGWVTMGSIQSALLGYGFFRILQKYGYGKNFSVAENAIIQTTAVAVATMPVTAGFISVIPALSMLTQEDNPPDGPFVLTYWQITLWTLSIAFFGAFAALPLRKQTIIKEKLKFPSGAATAKVIELLHGTENNSVYFRLDDNNNSQRKASSDTLDGLEEGEYVLQEEQEEQDTFISQNYASFEIGQSSTLEKKESPPRNKQCAEAYVVPGNWSKALPTLGISFLCSFSYKLLAEFVRINGDHVLASFPIFSWVGLPVMSQWGWDIYPAPGYIGQGMIMGPKTCFSMLAGAIVGFGILGPIAKSQNWAPGEIDNLENGASGWILWISLAIMLADSITSLAILVLRTSYNSLASKHTKLISTDVDFNDVPHTWWILGLLFTTVICTAIVSPLFSMAIYEPPIAVILAALIAILAVRALGETDLNPAGGIGKISQIVFSVIAPGKVVANVIAGAIAEAGAIQAGDMMQDFKTAYLLGVPPKPQFFAQLIGSFVSVFISVGVYVLYQAAWDIPGKELSVPSANIWIDMARLFNGGRLPEKVWPFAGIFAIAACSAVLLEQVGSSFARLKTPFIPSGIGFAVGMYLGPKYTIPRFMGCLIERYWLRYFPSTHSDLMIIVASGFVLGEGTGAIVIAVVKMLQSAV